MLSALRPSAKSLAAWYGLRLSRGHGWQPKAALASDLSPADDQLDAPFSILSKWWNDSAPSGAERTELNGSDVLVLRDGERRLLYSEFSQGVRTRLVIDASAHVTVKSGSMEVTKVKVIETPGETAAGVQIKQQIAETSPSGCEHDTVSVAASTPASRQGSEEEGARRQIIAEVPERYASIEIRSHGGNVDVDSVNEAGLQIDSGGGLVALGRVKASHAICDTSGGGFRATLLVAEKVRVQASSVEIDRLMGKDVAVHQATNPVASQTPLRITAAYVQDKLELDSGGADLQLGTLSCEPGTARIRSGGRIAIDSLDGSADIQAGTDDNPGDVALHCHDNLRGLSLIAGDTRLRLSPSLAGKLVVSVPSGIHVPGLPEGVQMRWEDDFQLHDTAHDSGESPVIRLNVRQSSRVTVEVESWIQALSRRTKTEGS